MQRKILHLPFTTFERFISRKTRKFWDQQKRLVDYVSEENVLSDEQMFEKAIIVQGRLEHWLSLNRMVKSADFNISLKSTVDRLRPVWNRITSSEYSPESEASYPDSLNLEVVSYAIRKFYDAADRLWKEK